MLVCGMMSLICSCVHVVWMRCSVKQNSAVWRGQWSGNFTVAVGNQLKDTYMYANCHSVLEVVPVSRRVVRVGVVWVCTHYYAM
jgi:hypothetical protein